MIDSDRDHFLGKRVRFEEEYWKFSSFIRILEKTRWIESVVIEEDADGRFDRIMELTGKRRKYLFFSISRGRKLDENGYLYETRDIMNEKSLRTYDYRLFMRVTFGMLP